MNKLHAPIINDKCFCPFCKVRMRLEDILREFEQMTYEVKYTSDSEKEALLRELDLRKLEKYENELKELVKLTEKNH